MEDPYLPIADYALIGNCRTAALISKSGSIDWYCPGRFDAPAVLCRLLDCGRGGYFSVGLPGGSHTERRYVGDSNVLETTHRTDRAEVRVQDFMPISGDPEHAQTEPQGIERIVRRVEVVRGEPEIRVRFKPTFDYARTKGESTAVEDGVLAQSDGACIGCSCPGVAFTRAEDGAWEGTMRLRGGEVRFVSLVHCNVPNQARTAMEKRDSEDELQVTREFWERWVSQSTYHGPYRSQVLRSALALKLLTYDPTGAIVAAPTTSLPEDIGGKRNWDYRYTWLRDSSLILYALLTVGYHDEARHFIEWLCRVLHGRLKQGPQIMYTVDGNRDIPERELDYLDGYMHSRPVRVGNAAAGQRQLDIYGELLTAAYVQYHRPPGADRAPAGGTELDAGTWAVLRSLVDDAARSWQEPDEGIWEVRSGAQQFLYSKLMCWAAVDRGIKLSQEYDLDADLGQWCKARDAIREAIETKGYNERIGAFTQAFGSSALDATALMIPRVGFLPATDERVLSTIECIRDHLTSDGLVYRYRTEDGLAGGEGTFLICTFWLIDALALAGRMREARDMYEHVLGLANDVGLLSEEIEPRTGRFLGNFPQGFTHLALIRTAADLAHGREHGAEKEPVTQAERVPRARRAASEPGG